jgi:transcriptional regulator with XRE-family HTH domain
MNHLDLQKQVGMTIRKLRRQRGLSQCALANTSGLSRTYLSGVEMGKRNLTLQTLSRLGDALGVSTGDFFSPGDDTGKALFCLCLCAFEKQFVRLRVMGYNRCRQKWRIVFK